MFEVQCVAKTVFVTFLSMPLLTELVSSEDGFCYRHGAPNGAVPQSQHSIPIESSEEAMQCASRSATQKILGPKRPETSHWSVQRQL